MPGPKAGPKQCTDCTVDKPHPKTIHAEGVYCAGCWRTRPGAKYVLETALPRNDGAPDESRAEYEAKCPRCKGQGEIAFPDGRGPQECSRCKGAKTETRCGSCGQPLRLNPDWADIGPPGNNVGLLDEALIILGERLRFAEEYSQEEQDLMQTISLIERARAPEEPEQEEG